MLAYAAQAPGVMPSRILSSGGRLLLRMALRSSGNERRRKTMASLHPVAVEPKRLAVFLDVVITAALPNRPLRIGRLSGVMVRQTAPNRPMRRLQDHWLVPSGWRCRAGGLGHRCFAAGSHHSSVP